MNISPALSHGGVLPMSCNEGQTLMYQYRGGQSYNNAELYRINISDSWDVL